MNLENSRFEEYVKGMKRFIGMLAVATAVILTLTCKAPDLFSEYDGQSFLSTTSLQSDTWKLMPDYTFETSTSAADYMDYDIVSSSGGPNGGPVYRLEIKNLLKIVLDTYSFLGSGGPGGSSTDTNLLIRNAFPALDPVLAEAKGQNLFTAKNTTAQDTWVIASDGPQSGYIDNVRVVRDIQSDFDLRLRMKLNFDHRQDLELIPGYYRFSVSVKQETIGAANIFHSDRVELSINGYDIENKMNVLDSQVFYKTQELHDLYSQSGDPFSGDWSSEWVSLTLASNQTIQVPNFSENPVMELTISPSNPGSSDAGWNRLSAGSILISEPILEYSDKPWD
jgi:hypothetical protein